MCGKGDKGFQKAFREHMVKDGAFDGRFRNRVEDCKRREKDVKMCRRWDWRDAIDADDGANEDDDSEFFFGDKSDKQYDQAD